MSLSVRKYKFENDSSIELEVVHLQNLTRNKASFLILPHRTNFYHIFLFDQTSAKHIVDFRPIEVESNSLLCLNKDRIHQFDASLNYNGYVLIFTDTFFCTTAHDLKFLNQSILFNDLNDHPYFKPNIDRWHHLRKLFLEIESILIDSPFHSKSKILKNLLENVLLFCEGEKINSGIPKHKKSDDLDYTQKFKNILDKDFRTERVVQYYAEQLSISEKRLGQATAIILGKTPKVIIDERCILEAKRLLIYENLSIKEIGFSLGFVEPTNFIKYFKRIAKETPAEFRLRYLPHPVHN